MLHALHVFMQSYAGYGRFLIYPYLKKKGQGKRLEIYFETRCNPCSCRPRITYGWCHGSFFSLGLLRFLLIKPGWALSLKSYLYSALGCETGKVLYRVYCIVLLYCKLPKARELYNPLSNKAMNNRQAQELRKSLSVLPLWSPVIGL